MNSERYCKRCGEDAWSFYLCETCYDEFCEDCGTRREVEDQMCHACIAKADAFEQSLATVPPMDESRVLPCMRDWYAKNVLAPEAKP